MRWRRAQLIVLGYLEDFLEKVEPELTGLCRMSESEMNISVADKEHAGRKNKLQRQQSVE